jgi:ubiquinone/menaquinone biosynthesis C-methylase UbiE
MKLRLVTTVLSPASRPTSYPTYFARLTPGMRVLDIAAGTGLAAEAALKIVGPTGHVTAADLSPAMVEKSRERLGQAKNVSVAVEDGQALSFPDESFDAVVCSLGLMFFPDALRGLAEFVACFVPVGALLFQSTLCQNVPTTLASTSPLHGMCPR